MHSINLSVRALAEYAFRSGHLDNTYMSNSRAMEGVEIHKRLQDMEGAAYEKEYFLKKEIEYEGMTYILEGRADGIYRDDNLHFVDEIKSTFLEEEDIRDDNITHWCQAFMYAYMYASMKKLDSMGIRLRYCNVETFKTVEFIKIMDFQELEKNLFEALEKYHYWARTVLDWKLERKTSIKGLDFPHEGYRKGQREMSVSVYQSIKDRKNIFIQAPTGIGKTISTLYPAIKYMGYKSLDKIYYMTAKSTTKEIAFNTIKDLSDKGLKLKTVIITAKEKICFMEECNCDKDYCPYAYGYFDKINEALKYSFEEYDMFSREAIEEISEEFQVCPFEFTLDLSLVGDLTICDYNYFYDPRAALKRGFGEENKGTVVLIDEAHNLSDRARSMYSAELFKKDFLEVSRPLKERFKKDYNAIRKVNKAILDIMHTVEEGGFSVIEEPDRLLGSLRNMNRTLDEWLKRNKKNENYSKVLELFFQSSAFLKMSELFCDDFDYYAGYEDGFKVKLFCKNPSNILREINEKVRSVVFFSATLIPLKYYSNILGGTDKDNVIRFESPFDNDNLDLILNSGISMKYRDRGKNAERVCLLINKYINVKKGNYIIFFPSYSYLKEIHDLYSQYYDMDNITVQKPNMSEAEYGELISGFYEDDERIVFSVIGGVLSEGIDLVEDFLIGVMILGVGLPRINFESDLVMEYYRERYNTGFEFSYMYPGFNKVLQASGRVIRTEKDAGTVLLVDDRYSEQRYRNLFPDSWNNYKMVNNLSELESELTEFWRERKDER
ncbi:Rad3-related DNA helicase [Dethiosulfatibacter aminovorans DSM 17477]|uniref:Rad3-related DNA helicase n=1 Tax=Dethiosulfatibacter aminovorans DSM 17477 TaxID=1121476 RepID=A0A1M6K1I7_9FIRM|nr:helicase C-terminal domain-containing protein [Dethiosulfatibacter aminovorans]SHJ52722.1 Rad3-related DNA helicase [Dethiosulfatibacter aminovorans DSM 17477]